MPMTQMTQMHHGQMSGGKEIRHDAHRRAPRAAGGDPLRRHRAQAFRQRVIGRLTFLWIALQTTPAWADHPTPLRGVSLSRTAAALTLAAMLVIVVLIGIALVRLFMGSRDESERP
jgi:hypothetical protein